MISRLMLSLKKASRDKNAGWTTDALSEAYGRTGSHMEFITPSNGIEDEVATTSYEVELPDFSHDRVREKSKEEKV